jgi:hypothetical protein
MPRSCIGTSYAAIGTFTWYAGTNRPWAAYWSNHYDLMVLQCVSHW